MADKERAAAAEERSKGHADVGTRRDKLLALGIRTNLRRKSDHVRNKCGTSKIYTTSNNSNNKSDYDEKQQHITYLYIYCIYYEIRHSAYC